MRQIRMEQKKTDAIIKFNTMWKIIKDTIAPKRVAKQAINAILESTAIIMSAIYCNAVLIAGIEGRTTVMKRDLSLANEIKMMNPAEEEHQQEDNADPVIPFKSMRRIVKELLAPKRVTKKAVDKIIQGADGLVAGIFHNAMKIAKNGKRTTVLKKDFELAHRIMVNPIN